MAEQKVQEAERLTAPAAKRNRKIIVYAVSILLFAGVLVLALKFLNSAREEARAISCASNLKSIGLAFKQYAMDFDGYFPPGNGTAGLEILRSGEYLSDYKVYICPSSTAKATIAGPLDTTAYEYYGGLRDTPENANEPLMWDKHENHDGRINVLYVDGKVKMDGKDFFKYPITE